MAVQLDTAGPLPNSLAQEIWGSIENKAEFGKRAYGKRMMFYPGELDTVSFPVTQLCVMTAKSFEPIYSEAVNSFTLVLFLVQNL